jgi:hypothetical protein
MSIVKSFATGVGDTYYIRHNSDNFTIIDCRIDEYSDSVIDEIADEAALKGVVRFISTHPDDDHIRGLANLDDQLALSNFYVVKNQATKPDDTIDFRRYCELRDDAGKAFYLSDGCWRRWMNRSGDGRGASGINVLWPRLSNQDFREALTAAAEGRSPNNISTVLSYRLKGGATMLWMGDLETEFMERIEDEVELPKVDVAFAAHHGRARIPASWITEMDPGVIVLGEAPKEHLEYYDGRNHIRQNSAGDITFDCHDDVIDIYVEEPEYVADFLDNVYLDDDYGSYIGTLRCG